MLMGVSVKHLTHRCQQPIEKLWPWCWNATIPWFREARVLEKMQFERMFEDVRKWVQFIMKNLHSADEHLLLQFCSLLFQLAMMNENKSKKANLDFCLKSFWSRYPAEVRHPRRVSMKECMTSETVCQWFHMLTTFIVIIRQILQKSWVSQITQSLNRYKRLVFN